MRQAIPFTLENSLLCLRLTGEAEGFLSYTLKATGQEYRISGPIFEIDGESVPIVLRQVAHLAPPSLLSNGCTEYRCGGPLGELDDLFLEIIVRIAPHSPVVRFAYALHSQGPHRLTKQHGRDALTYLQTSLASLPEVTEVQCSEFIELVHSYCLAEHQLAPRHFTAGLTAMGPLLLASDTNSTFLVAYEHGSQVPDAFVEFQLAPDRVVALQAKKGNYLHGQPLDPDHSFTTIWLQIAAVDGDGERMASVYREFLLNAQSLSSESRKPLLFYNTWGLQERAKWWYQGAFLDPMYQERILAEIEVAHRMGLEVFVLDTGWYEKTGDWRVNLARFPDGLKAVKALLDRYGMRLGLWFAPTAVALSSKIHRQHPEYRMSWQGQPYPPKPIWETEESQPFCLVSGYSDLFADELIRLAREVGVTYFKWDAIDHACDAPGHWHGDETNSARERAENYTFGLVRQMTRIVERVSAVIPEAIFDFDITEKQRAVGLSFLSVGKYFLLNNGPYYESLDIPFEPGTANGNVYFFPGQARGWVTRTPLAFDKWIPSTLFLTHYYPDDPVSSQMVNLASLILGQNGIWGDLLHVSEEGIARIAATLQRYKTVREAMTEASPVFWGKVGGSPEVYEKISEKSGQGAVVVFSPGKGSYTYLTARRVAQPYWHTEGVSVALAADGTARLDLEFPSGGAKIVFFGIE
jgi:alpha-galactosidase